ncbi:insulinase family protein [Clostridium oryzae]|uniref:Peptidase M16C associated n=1 Tax=Clostridium oryzae TaxID=1450648 RepID=A0A1V4ILP8_9CLOT|nr:insulinase family protein [Clostridium oryzae]OPJ60958.1 peptidase M16C associated [Clostridium oryzae]
MKSLKKYIFLVFAFIFMFQNVNLVPVSVQAKPLSFSNVEYGFKLLKKTYVKSIDTTVMQYVHLKSGAKLVYLKNNDPNKTFSISFRTLPCDNTGINHIIEHCVLDGSRKYPVNNALINMSNQSLCSNANGSTDLDNTSYYVQTANDADYMNFMDVILDGVFYPSFLANRNIFFQEGGHYELNSDKSKAVYSGVVYGEVGGIQPEDILLYKSIRSVLPQTVYKWDQGGRQQDIPNLSYEKAVKTYRKFYKPSNSYIYLYGDLNIDKVLKYIDTSYLCKFHKDRTQIKIPIQKPFKEPVDKTYYYNSSCHADKKDAYFSQNFVISRATDAEAMNSFEVIINLLMPLFNNAFEQKGLTVGDYGLLSTFNQPLFYITSGPTNANKRPDFKTAIEDTLAAAVNNGIDREDIKHLIQNYETYKNVERLQVQNGSEMMRINVIRAWMHDGDPAMYLDADKYIKVLKRELKERYLEKLIKKYLIDNNNRSFVTLKAKSASKFDDKGTIKVKKLPKSQLNRIIQHEKNLKKWQQEAGCEKALSKLPVLNVSDIRVQLPKIKTSVTNGVKILYTPVDTSDACYYNVYFDSSFVEQDKIPYINLMCDILNDNSNTIYDKYNSADGSDDSTYGKIQFTAGAYGKFNSVSEYSPKVTAFIPAHKNNIARSLELLKEIITKPNFEEKNKIKDFMKAAELTAKIYTPYYRFLAYLSPKDSYIDCLAGYENYKFLKARNDKFDTNWNEIQKNLEKVYDDVFRKDNLIIGFVGTEDEFENFNKSIQNFLKGIKSIDHVPVRYSFDDNLKNEAFTLNSNIINDMIKGYNYRKLGYQYNGSFQVLNAITDRYMTNEVRTRGGYGGNTYINQDGNVYFMTNRMLDIQKSVKIFDSVSSYVKKFNADSNEMMKYKIGAIKNLQIPDSQVGTAIRYQDQAVRGKTRRDYEKELKDILNTSSEDINRMSRMVDKVINQNVFLVAGDKKKIDKEKIMFQKIIDALE